MDAAGEEDSMTYDQVAELFTSMEGPSAQERIDCIVPYIISLLPAPFVPAPDASSDSDDDDHFSLTSSDSDDADAEGAAAVAHPFLAASGDGEEEDHISRLPDDLLSHIIARLPTKESARTMALSTRWRGVWAATALAVDDAHFKDADRSRRSDDRIGHHASLVRAISRCVDAHPGPVRRVRVTHVPFYYQQYALEHLVASLADKGVEDLVLFNRPWPLDMPIPGDILRCASLERLYLGVWRFPPGIAARPRGPFPNLRELGLFHSIVLDEDFDALLARCHRLQVLSVVMGYSTPSRLRVASRSLQVVVDWLSSFDEVVVDDAPSLERLFFETIGDRRPIRIVRAPRLEVLGFLDFHLHALEIGGVVVKAGVAVRANAMVPSLKILAVKVRSVTKSEAKLLLTLLKFFPRLETLHLKSVPISLDSLDGVELEKSLGSCECLESHLKTVTLHRSLAQFLFQRFILKEAKMLETVAVICTGQEGVPDGLVGGGGRSCATHYVAADLWSYRNSIDLSLDDPFCVVRHVTAL